MKGGRNMTETIPVNLLERWISELQSILKAEITEGKADLTLNQGMRHGLGQIEHRITTWLRLLVRQRPLMGSTSFGGVSAK